MNDDDARLDRELEERHRHGESLAQDIRALFFDFCRQHDLHADLPFAIHQTSQHVSEIAFWVLDADTGIRWRIFPSILIQTRPAPVTTFSLFSHTEDDQAVSQEFATLEAFADSIGKQVLHVAGGAPQLRNERRISARRTLNTPTLITSTDGTVRLTAMIINHSRDGVLVELPSADDLPAHLILLLDEREQRFDKVWQMGRSAGLVLVDKPS